MLQNVESCVDRAGRIGRAHGQNECFQDEMRHRAAPRIAVWFPELRSDHTRERLLVTHPHPAPVVAQPGRREHELDEARGTPVGSGALDSSAYITA